MRERLADLIDLADNAFIGTIHVSVRWSRIAWSHGRLQAPPVDHGARERRLALLKETLLENAALKTVLPAAWERAERSSTSTTCSALSAGRNGTYRDRGPGRRLMEQPRDAEHVYRDYNDRLAIRALLT